MARDRMKCTTCNLFRMIRISVAFLLIAVFLTGCYSVQMRTYYSNRDNLLSVTGTVTKITYGENSNHKTENALVLCLSDMTVELDDNVFVMIPENLELAKVNGIQDMSVGDTVSITSAPRYFYDFFKYPIIAMTVNGKEVLDTETGYSNFIDWLQSNRSSNYRS